MDSWTENRILAYLWAVDYYWLFSIPAVPQFCCLPLFKISVASSRCFPGAHGIVLGGSVLFWLYKFQGADSDTICLWGCLLKWYLLHWEFKKELEQCIFYSAIHSNSNARFRKHCHKYLNAPKMFHKNGKYGNLKLKTISNTQKSRTRTPVASLAWEYSKV